MAGIAIPQVITDKSGGQFIDGSLKFDSNYNQYLTRTFGSGTDETWTWSAWIKRDNLGSDHRLFTSSADGNNQGGFKFIGDQIQFFSRKSGTFNINLYTEAVFRDTGWYHMMVAVDTTIASPSYDRVKIYVNGVPQTIDSSYNTYPSQNYETRINTNIEHVIGRYNAGNSQYMNGAMSQVYFIDGQALGPRFFGFNDPLTGTWRPRKLRAGDTSLNDGTTWSSGIPGNVLSGYPATNGFDGNASTFVYADNNSTMTWTAPKPVSGKKIEVYIYGGNTHPIVNVNGQSTGAVVGGVAQNGWIDVTHLCPGGALQTIQAFGQNIGGVDRSSGWSAVRVDGEILKDSAVSAAFGTNGFYLPMDGNSPIGEDKSGNGNDWRPINFGGSVELDKATGAKPILNTTQGGTQAGAGVFGSKENKTVTVTVASKTGGGNAYFFDSVERDSLATIRGTTITFDTTDSTNNSHPFKLSSTNADSSGGTEYTDGVAYYINGSVTTGSDYVSNYETNGGGTGFRGIKWTVPHNVSTTYYYCTVHNGMGEGGRLTSTTDETKADPYAWKNTLALPLVDVDDVSNRINAGSTTKATATTNAVSNSVYHNFYGGSYYFDGSTDYITVTQSSDFDFGSGDCTVECWLYISSHAGDKTIVGRWESSDQAWQLSYGTTGGQNKFSFMQNISGTQSADSSVTSTSYVGRWVHLAGQRSGNTLQIFVDGVLEGTSSVSGSHSSLSGDIRVGGRSSGNWTNGYIQDVRIYKGIAKYTASSVGEHAYVPASTSPDILLETPSGVSGSSKLTKITDGAVSFDGSGDYLQIGQTTDLNFGTGDFTIESFFYVSDTSNSDQSLIASGTSSFASGAITFKAWNTFYGNQVVIQPYDYNSGGTPILRSGSALSSNKWYHVAYTRSGNTHMLFIDGELKDTTTSSISINFNDNNYTMIGYSNLDSSNGYMDGFISNLRVIKGTALYTSSFTPPTAPLTDVTNTKLLCCQSNTSATEGAVKPGTITANGDAVATTFNPFNTDINTVRGQETGYATWNPLAISASNPTLSNGNLSFTGGGSDPNKCLATTAMSSGKFYAEFTVISGSINPGLATQDINLGSGFLGDNAYGWTYGSNGKKYHNDAVATGAAYGDSYTAGDAIGVAFDADNGILTFYKNGVSQGAAYTGLTSGPYFFATGGSNMSHQVNFGQKPFSFPPPEGFQPLNAANVRPETVIARPDQYVGVTTYTGDGTSSRTINLPLSGDLVWAKKRNETQSHQFADTVRGNNSVLKSNDTDGAENPVTDFSGGGITSINSTSFTISQGTSNNDNLNESDDTFVVWSWKAGGNKNTFNIDNAGYASAAAAGLGASGNSWDSDPTGASIGTKQGFSIIKHTGTGSAGTLPHGLTQKPTFYISKPISTTGNWVAYFDFIDGSLDYLYLNTTDSKGNSGQSLPTSELFSYGYTANEYIHYLWHDVPGLQKFGTYTGAGSAYPFIELGFRPALIWIKDASTSGTHYDWHIFDSTRNSFNLGAINTDSKNVLFANLNSQENKGSSPWAQIDFLSTGFRMTDASVTLNNSGGSTYIYCAWAEAPAFNLHGGGANAF